MSSPHLKRTGLRTAIAWVFLGLAYVVALSFYKSAMMEDLARQGLQSAQDQTQARVTRLFDEQRLPEIRGILTEDSYPPLRRLQILSLQGGALLFDSNGEAGRSSPEVRGQEREATVYFDGFQIRAWVPGPKYAVIYTFDGSVARTRLLAALLLGLMIAWGIGWLFSHRFTGFIRQRVRRGWTRFWRLRTKFMAAIVLINLITGGIVFVTLTQLQIREQTARIERDSVLFSQFSTAQVISNFNRFFKSNEADRFVPETKKIIASNENLVALRIYAKGSQHSLFDSEQVEGAQGAQGAQGAVASGKTPPSDIEAKTGLSRDTQAQLQTRDLAVNTEQRSGAPALVVVNTYRGDNSDTYWVEYVFSFQTLAKGIQAIRRQLLLDLIPSMGLGLMIAIIFAQLLISPIRRLVAALGRVSAGDYEAHVGHGRSDELGDLVTAFNLMTEELRKKKELRKYLSDATYRMIMKGNDTREGARIGGSRVSATVLFSDIRDFVGHCEALEAEEVTAMLNEYFSDMVEVIYKHGGEVDKFIGDALLAVFYDVDGAPTTLQALYCALEMRERLGQFNERRRAAGKAPIDTGVGMTYGELISGPIGSKDRMDFTVIGDVVNLASRIEKLSKQGRHTKIVFSYPVEEKVRGLLDYEEMQTEKVRGKEETVRTFELIGVRDLGALLGNLGSPDLALRRRSVELLGYSRNSAALPDVIKMLSDSDDGTRLQAVLTVAKLGGFRGSSDGIQDDVAFNALVARFVSEPSDKVLSALISALGRLSTPTRAERVLEVLRPYLESRNERIVANTVEALGQSRDPRCVDLILPKLMSRNNRVKANAALAMFTAGHIEVIDTLKPMLMHSDPLMRSSAAFALGELTGIAETDHELEHWKARSQTLKLFLAELQECVPMLVACLRDTEPMVRRQAVIALGKIKDKSAVLPMIDLLGTGPSNRELMEDVSQALRSIGSHRLVREVIARLSSGKSP